MIKKATTKEKALIFIANNGFCIIQNSWISPQKIKNQQTRYTKNTYIVMYMKGETLTAAAFWFWRRRCRRAHCTSCYTTFALQFRWPTNKNRSKLAKQWLGSWNNSGFWANSRREWCQSSSYALSSHLFFASKQSLTK